MSWENSETRDVLWGARRCVLTASSAVEVRMDQMDPTGQERIQPDYDASTQLSFLYEVGHLLARANEALREVQRRMEVADGEGDVPVVPDDS